MIAVAIVGLSGLLQLLANVIALMTPGVSIVGTLAELVVGIAVLSLVLTGLVKGHRLAWQWGRVVGVLVVIHSALVIGGVIGLVGIALNLVLVVVLSLGSAKRFFRMYCPSCEKLGAANDFFFRTAKCKRCAVSF